MRVAVDCRVIQDAYHGIARNTVELLRAIAEHVEIVALEGSAPDERLSIRALRETTKIDVLPFHAPPASVREQLSWRTIIRRARADVLLVPYHLATPWFSPVPVVTIVHDCIFEADPAFAPTRRMLPLYRLATRIALRRAKTVVTVSHATRDALREFYGVELPPENVVTHGVNPWFAERCSAQALARARDQLGIPERYVLHVGVRRPHKNHVTLVRAFQELVSLEPRADLVLVGGRDRRFDDPVPCLVNELGLGERVHLLESVPDSLLRPLYQGAAVFAFPSLVEGFGLPVLEAMAAGVPVVASDTPAVAEAADNAAMLAPPLDVATWSMSLRCVLEDPALAETLRKAGNEAARRHTWDGAGRRVLDVLERTAAESSGARRRDRGRRFVTNLSPQLPLVPAIGATPPMSLRERKRRLVFLVAAVLAALAALVSRVAVASLQSERVPTVLNATWVVPQVLMRGGQPQDIDFVNMRDVFGVTAVVNLRAAGRIERHVVEGFRLDYLWIKVPEGEAPTEAQLRQIVRFLKMQAAADGVVFLHDQSGLDEAPTVAVMLEMLHGKPNVDLIEDAMRETPAEEEPFTEGQIAAINALAEALGQEPYRPSAHPADSAYRYPDASELRW